jgi:hypothetical protein
MSVWRILLLFLSLVLLGARAEAQVTLEPHTQNGVTYLSGGIGPEEVSAIKAAQGEYNLRLLFAVQGSGQYLADVQVKLLDQKGNTVLDATSDGPYFLARLKPGSYRLVAESAGKPITRSVEVPSSGAAALSLYWPAS